MEGSAYQTLKSSVQFLWHNKRIAAASVGFSLVGVVIVFILALAALGIAGVFGLSTSFGLSSLATVPRTYAWATGIAAGSLGFLALGFVSILALSFFYPRVSEAYYILSILRHAPKSFGHALSHGATLTVRAWKIPFVGLLLIPAIMLSLLGLTVYLSQRELELMRPALSILLIILLIIVWVIIYLAQFFAAQLVVDGETSFTRMFVRSWLYFKRSLIRLLAIWIMLGLAGIPVSIASSYLGPIAAAVNLIWGFLVAMVAAVAVNKVYLQARARD